MSKRRRPVLAVIAMLLVAVAANVSAQPSGGRLSGTVRDASGAALPGVTVTVTNQATSASQAVVSGGDGNYAVENLAPGTYTVSADLKGFARSTRKDVQVTAAAPTVDFTLSAAAAEEITV